MQRRYLLNIFLPNLTITVFTTQFAWADTVQAPIVNNVQEGSAPSYLNSNPNPLQFPTQSEEVRIQGTQPISLQKAQQLARNRNRSLQVTELNLERSRSSLVQQQSTLNPTFGVSTDITHFRSR